ncbi:MAG: AAA family ATPase, partial [Gallionellaceae bacterium]|nr:AAA family ATPase [Gallionellaceae bacterium]
MDKPLKRAVRRRHKPLPPEMLYQHCDPALLTFESTIELEGLAEIIGQARAVEAIQFGVGIRRDGYNIFVLGHPGSGRYTLSRKELESRAATEPAPADWCYLNNFEQTNKPKAIKLPAGRGTQFQKHMRQFVEEFGSVIPVVFEGEEYRTRLEAMNDEFKHHQEKLFEDLGEEAKKQGVALIQTRKGFALAPYNDGEIVTPEEFDKLPEEERQHYNEMIEQFDEKLRKIVHQVPRMVREHQTKIREFNRETIALAAGHLIEELHSHYQDLPEILDFLDTVRADIIESASELREQRSADELTGVVVATPLQRYQVNLLVDHSESKGAPVVYENHPTYQNLLGRIEHLAHMGMLVTNFSLIKSGALHRANGGYLILDAGKLLIQPYAWEGLKRAMLSREIRIESLGEIFGLVSTLSLQPQPIPLDLKVV